MSYDIDVTTSFQKQFIEEIASRSDFKQFVLLPNEDRPTKYGRPGPFNVMWYDTSNALHVVRLGQTRVIREVNPV